MDAVSYSDLRENLKTYMDKVYDDKDALIITQKDKKNLVLISRDEYNSLIETNYLLSNEEIRAPSSRPTMSERPGTAIHPKKP
jgi:antitoxin YefM